MPSKPRVKVAAVSAPYVGDSLVNLTARIGVEGDKSIANTYVLPTAGLNGIMGTMYAQAEIDAAYRVSWLARKIVDIPPYDMTREWRLWQAKDDQIELIENEEKRLKYRMHLRRAMTWGRLYGGGAIILGADQGRSDQPLEVDKVKKGGLPFIHSVTRWQLPGRDIDTDPMSEGFGKPKMYHLAAGTGVSIEIHPSRVITFIGNEIPSGSAANANDGWGDPIWMTISDPVKNADLVSSSIASLVPEAKIDVISIPQLLAQIGTKAYEDKLLRRLNLAMVTKSMNNTLILDGGNGDGKSGEIWNRKEIAFAGLPDILRLFLAVAAGAADIPATRLLGKSPDGMNSTGDNDLRNYYDALKSRQSMEMWPAVEPLDEMMFRSIFGARPADIYFNSAPLWQMTPAEKADIDAKKAATTKIYVDTALIPNDALAEAVQNQLVEDGTYPGLEAALQASQMEADILAPQPSPLELLAQAQQQKQLPAPAVTGAATTTDATPRTLYVRRDVLNSDAITRWAKGQGFKTVVTDLHVTIMYSRSPVDWMKVSTDWVSNDKDGGMIVAPGGARIVERLGADAIVLLFNSSQLSWRHEEIKRAGASFDYSTYQPHVTITYMPPDTLDLSKIEPYRGLILLGPEIFEEIDSNVEVAEDGMAPFVDEYNPSQPRDPKGSATGGQWTGGGGGGAGGGGGSGWTAEKTAGAGEKIDLASPQAKALRAKLRKLTKDAEENAKKAQSAWETGDTALAELHKGRIELALKQAKEVASQLPHSKTSEAAIKSISSSHKQASTPLAPSSAEKGFTVGVIEPASAASPTAEAFVQKYLAKGTGSSLKEQMHSTVQKQKIAAATGEGGISSYTEPLTSSEIAGLRAYSSNGYRSINSTLRGKPTVGAQPDYVETHTKRIDSAMAKSSITQEATIWRGVRIDPSKIPAHFKEGDTYMDKGFMSFSKSEAFARGWGYGAVLKLTVSPGHRAIDMKGKTLHEHEQEVLIPRGSQFKIKKVESNTVHLELM